MICQHFCYKILKNKSLKMRLFSCLVSRLQFNTSIVGEVVPLLNLLTTHSETVSEDE